MCLLYKWQNCDVRDKFIPWRAYSEWTTELKPEPGHVWFWNLHALNQAALPPLCVLKMDTRFLPSTSFPGQSTLKGRVCVCVCVCARAHVCVSSPSEDDSLSRQAYLEIFCENSRKGPAFPPGSVSNTPNISLPESPDAIIVGMERVKQENLSCLCNNKTKKEPFDLVVLSLENLDPRNV